MKEKFTLAYLFLFVVHDVIKGYIIRSGNGAKNISSFSDIGSTVVISNTRDLTPKEEETLKKINHYKQMTFIQASSSSSNMMHEQVQTELASRVYEVTGIVQGMVKDHPLSVALGAQYSNYFDSLEVVKLDDSNIRFKFSVKPGKYYLRVYGNTYMTPSAIKITVPCDKCKYINKTYSDVIKVTPYESSPDIFIYNWELQASSSIPLEHINTVHSDEADISHGNSLGDELKLDASAAATSLKTFYGIELTGVWGTEYSDRLLSVLSNFPEGMKLIAYDKEARARQRKNQKWVLTDAYLGAFDMDIELHKEPESEYSKTVRVSKKAFSFSTKLVKNPGSNGKYFSRRLEKVIIRALLSSDYELFSIYFQQKHGVVLLDPNVNSSLIVELTGYSSNEYQLWSQNIEELIEIATSWDEYPLGFQKVKGLKYLLRRKNGLKHPQHPTAPAVAFPAGKTRESFIEFMESAFVNYRNVSHLVIHEIGHFIYVNNVTMDLQNEWIQLGKWYKEPLSPSQWATREEVEFVSAYAHDKNPGEDFAESIASFVLNPRLLNSRSPKKYKWIKEKLFGGSFYATTGSHLFEVLNFGNNVFYYPGKVKRIRATVTGTPSEDKKVRVDIYLLSTKGTEGCAKHAYARLFSEQQTYRDVHFFPEGRIKCSHHLFGEFTITSSESRGRWISESLSFTGANNINRYVGIGSFLFYIYVNNQNEDIEKPIPLLDSIAVYSHNPGNRDDALMRLNILVLEDNVLRKHGGALASFSSKEKKSYSYSNYTKEMYNPEFNTSVINSDYFISDVNTSGFREVNMDACRKHTDMDVSKLKCFQVMNPVHIPKYCVGGRLYLRYFFVVDDAGNENTLNISSDEFYGDLKSTVQKDVTNPSVFNVKVWTQLKDDMEGGTLVTVECDVYDDLSGIEYVLVYLRDPHGTILRTAVPTEDLPKGGELKRITAKVLLEKGSVGGTWMLDEIRAIDKCNNESKNIFTYSIYVQKT